MYESKTTRFGQTYSFQLAGNNRHLNLLLPLENVWIRAEKWVVNYNKCYCFLSGTWFATRFTAQFWSGVCSLSSGTAQFATHYEMWVVSTMGNKG